MSDPSIVIEEMSPHNNILAHVEQDDRVAYLYLKAPQNEEFGIKSCWIRNLSEAPEQLDVEGMRAGIPPMLPRDSCAQPSGQKPLRGEHLRLVWFPEGDGVALLEGNEILAAIPAWGGLNGFSGYARDCVGESSFCWKLDDDNDFTTRITIAEDYWAAWNNHDNSPWSKCQDTLLDEYQRVLGEYSRYFAIDGNQWPPKALVRFDIEDLTYLLTLGVSLRPQPAVEMSYDDPSDYRRIEFGACFCRAVSDDTIMAFASYLSGQSSYPWEGFTFFGNGHTIGCDILSQEPKLKHFTFLLLKEHFPGTPPLEIPSVDGEKVTLLWTVPITRSEQELAEKQGSETLMQQITDRLPIGS